MKTVLLAGGKGTRLAEYTHAIPKPMVEIGGWPILCHIMRLYDVFGYNEFLVAAGYKNECIKDYFSRLFQMTSDVKVDLKTGKTEYFNGKKLNFDVSILDTGLETMTGGRLLRLSPYLGSAPFMMTYGDGISDVNINDLVKFHREQKKLLTMTVVRPRARFGEVELSGCNVKSFVEKPSTNQGWINGGFFVLEPEVLDYIRSDQEMFEREPLERLVEQGQVAAFCHDGFWQCMDTLRDLHYLRDLYQNKPLWPTI
jgi:glucose-1-phosphate cytidylyltransferase